MKILPTLSLALAMAAATLTPAAALVLQEVALPPVTHMPAELVVVAPDGTQTTYSQADLERFATYQMTTVTPWRENETDFQGVLLTDVLQAHGLGDARAIVVTAENDYTTEIPRELWEDIQVLIATRVEGQPHSRRHRGPIQFVIDMGQMEASEIANEGHLVWMAARIEAAD